MASIVKMKNINKIYGEEIKTQVLFDINLDVEEGSFISIIGQSGSGKSTLLNILGTLDNPTSGSIYIDNVEVNKLKKSQISELRNKTIGFVFQFHYLLPEFTALENVLMPFEIGNNKITKEVKERAEELLNLVGLESRKNYNINMLSGGQQQRVAIARALMNKPKLILADEPTGNLDSNSTKEIYNLLRDVNKTLGTTFIIITHDRKIAELADRIVEIKDGKIETDIKKR